MKLSLYRRIETLDDETTVVTGNPRLARELKRVRAAYETKMGRVSWRTPDVVPFSAWVSRSWEQHRDWSPQRLPSLLTSSQERWLWEISIVDDLTGRGVTSLLNVAGAARQSQRANAILDDWGTGAAHHGAHELWVGEDARAFREWRKRLHKRCLAEDWVVPSAVTVELIEGIKKSPDWLPARVVFAGFYTLTEGQRRLVSALSGAGVEVSVEGFSSGDGSPCKTSFVDASEELDTIARWARTQLEGGSRSVGVVVPDLMRSRALVERSFESVLSDPRDYEVSVPPSLASLPVVRDALLVLRFLNDPVPIPEFEQVLRSPFIRSAREEFHQRSRLVGVLRQLGKPEVSLANVGGHLNTAPGFAQTLKTALAVRKTWPSSQSMARWTVALSQWLKAFGWPGEDPQTQAVEQFHDALDALAGLGMVSGLVSLKVALAKFEQLCAEDPLRPGAHHAAVQIMTVDESVGLQFEQLWVSGLHDGVWPVAARPNPFLPASWLRRHQVPHSSPEWELSFAGCVTSLWKGASNRTLFSHSRVLDDQTLRESPMLRGLKTLTGPSLSVSEVATPRQRLWLARPSMALLKDFTAPSVTGDETIRGGTSVFKNQAACAFRGFAIHRLGASTLEVTSSGLDALDRGSLLHDVLAWVWTKITSYAELIQFSHQELDALVLASIAATFRVWDARRPGLLAGRFGDLERARVGELIHAWLAVEKQRSPFMVDAAETNTRARVGDIPITMRPDRIDRLDDGSLFIVDYKTGDASRSSWFGKRMDEPQLPLYCTAIEAAGERVAGVAFATVKMGKMGFSGFADRDAMGPGITNVADSNSAESSEKSDPKVISDEGSDSPWSNLKRQWRDSLDGLAREFLRGGAAVAPKSTSTCRFCALGALCRVRELRLLEPDEMEAHEHRG